MEPSHIKTHTVHEIEVIATELLNSTFPNFLDVPIDIDLVAEKSCGVLLVLIPDPVKKFNVIATLLYKPNKYTITLDANTDSFNRPRANFSVAHELGHVALHKDLYKDCKNIEDSVLLNERIRKSY